MHTHTPSHTLSRPHTHRSNGDVSDNVERLLRQLEISFNNLESLSEKEREKQDALDIKCLQIMRAIIHNEVVHIDPQLLEDSPPDYRKRCVTRVHPLQNAVQDFNNAVSRVVPMLSHPNDIIIKEVLAFLKATFFSGNPHVQKGMKHLLDTREERLFSTVQALLQNAAVTFNERTALVSQMDARLTSDIFLQTDTTSLLSPSTDMPTPSRRPKLATAVTIDIEEGQQLEESIIAFKVCYNDLYTFQ